MLKYREEWALSRMAHLYLLVVVWVVLQVLWPANPPASWWSSCGQWRLFVLWLLLLVSSSWLVCCLCWRRKNQLQRIKFGHIWETNLHHDIIPTEVFYGSLSCIRQLMRQYLKLCRACVLLHSSQLMFP
jgi:hypothetical protein